MIVVPREELFCDSGEPTKLITPEEYEVIKIKKGGENGKRTKPSTN